MTEQFTTLLAQTTLEQGNTLLLLIGLAIFAGTVGARVFKHLKIPQVVGYIAIGILMGDTGLKLIHQGQVAELQPFNHFALGVIGFLVGGELQIGTFRKYAKKFIAILLGEGLVAFILVGASCSIMMYLVVHNIPVAIASGLVLGAIASATDPASTIDVLWEYRTRGVLTLSITAIVVMDDALAITLYGLGTSTAEMVTESSGSLLGAFWGISFTLFGAVGLGFVVALLLRFLLRWLHQPEKSLAIAVGLILVLISVAVYADMDVILAALTLGFTLVNIAPRRSTQLFKTLRSFSTPIYVLFFVLVGARLSLTNMPGWLLGMVALYVVGRTIGKMFGAWAASTLVGADRVVGRYLGLGLFAQGGVAVGLSIMASQHLSGIQVTDDLALGDTIIFIVTCTTIILQIVGPLMVKLSAKLADEIGRNVIEEDVIASWRVSDVMDRNIKPINASAPMKDMVRLFADHDYLVYPVINSQGQLGGTVSLAGIKSALSDKSSWAWLVASDVAEPVTDRALQDAPLSKTLDHMRGSRIEQMPVVDSEENNRTVGMLDMARILKQVDSELIRRQTPIGTV